MEYQQHPLEEIRNVFRKPSMLNRMILINVVVWALISAGRVIAFLLNITDADYLNIIVEWLALPALPSLLLAKPWTILTYMFLHVDFFHILFNMLWLFWFGKIFLEYINSRQLLVTYILGGISGGLLYILFYNIFPVFAGRVEDSYALGASASVMAIVTAISFYVPAYSVYLLFIGRVKILYIALILFVLDFFMIRSGNAGGHVAHIGGALYGLLFIFLLRRRIDLVNLYERWRFSLLAAKTNKKSYASNPAPEYKNDTGRPLTDEEYNVMKAEKQKKIDTILDKISKSGYESLTEEEKELLFKSSG